MHANAAKALQKVADKPCYYKVCDEEVRVNTTAFKGTIRALHKAPKGPCKGSASKTGPHPYTCEACEALQHGKNSQLLHKWNRATNLKHPRSEDSQAIARHGGIRHKYCSKSELKHALHSQKMENANQGQKLCILSQANCKLLQDSWKSNATARPFIQQLLKLMDDNSLSQFDFNFLGQ